MLGPATVVLLSMLTAGGVPYDTVRLTDGGLARGTVVEDTADGVALQLPDGAVRRWPRTEIASLEYAKPAPAVTAPAPAEEAGRAEAPSDRTPAVFTAATGLGAILTTGDVGSRAGSTSDWWTGFMLFQGEAGFRIAQRWTTLVYLDAGGGDVADRLRAGCRDQGYECGAGSARLGVMERYTFEPAARRTPWIAIGTGLESAGVTIKGSAGTQRITFSGWEVLKLAAGYDFRFNRWFGLGLFGGVSLGSTSEVRVTGPRYQPDPVLGDRGYHCWFQVGGRAILFP